MEEGPIKIYSIAELDRFEKRFRSTNLLAAFKIGRALDVRCAECFGLLWSAIDWNKHTVKINKQLVYEDKMWTLRNTKTKSSIREIELQDSIFSYLKTQEKQMVEMGTVYRETKVAIHKDRNEAKEFVYNLDFINLKPNGELLTPDSGKVLARIARKEMGCNFRYHNLRLTHASWLVEKGLPVVVVKARLRHSKIETTLRYYQHVIDDMHENLLNALNSNE